MIAFRCGLCFVGAVNGLWGCVWCLFVVGIVLVVLVVGDLLCLLEVVAATYCVCGYAVGCLSV